MAKLPIAKTKSAGALSKKSGVTPPPTPPSPFQAQLRSLIQQKKYRQALESISKIRRSQPDILIVPSEAQIWRLRGESEFQQKSYKQAESSLRQALRLGALDPAFDLVDIGESYYWLAKSLLALNRLDQAVRELGQAFEAKTLPKDYNICYVKLLLLKGDTVAVEQLLKQTKHFPAAHQHWIRGVLALKAEQPDTAIAAFSKVKKPSTSGDRLEIWQVYTEQLLGRWTIAADRLGLTTSQSPFLTIRTTVPLYRQHPILQRLALIQQFKGDQDFKVRLALDPSTHTELATAMEVLRLLEQGNHHDAAHALLKSDSRRSSMFPELAAMRSDLLAIAGQQAMQEGELGCAEEFWQLRLRDKPFPPQLAVNLLDVLEENESDSARQLLATQLIRWLESEARQNPTQWPEVKLKRTLAHARCRLADAWMALNRPRSAMSELQQAERLCADSPEVVGRRGILAALDGRKKEARTLLTQALEGGCQCDEVYAYLNDLLKEANDPEALLEMRKRFGKRFGDINPEAEITIPLWVDALSTRDYRFFSRLVESEEEEESADPAVTACQIFVGAESGPPTASGRIPFDQSQATEEWDDLLADLPAAQQVSTLQAIVLSIKLFAKREKGVAALEQAYVQRLVSLEAQHPEATPVKLMLFALRAQKRDEAKLDMAIRLYLGSQSQPGNALAQIQLQIRRFAQTRSQYAILSTLIDETLQREPQNPLLLLAKATIYAEQSPTYKEWHEKGFDIARRLQDAKALQAFREEKAYVNAQEANRLLPDPDDLDDLNPAALNRFMEGILRKMFGAQLSPDELNQLMPEIRRMMESSMPDFADDDFDDRDPGGLPFGFPLPMKGMPPPPPPRRGRRR